MPRKPRIEKAGFYHIINRGVARTNIYLNDEDFLNFLEILQESSEDFAFEIYSFALMTNHYHLLIEMTKPNLSAAMQKINSRYSIYFNNRYKRVGSLWQGRFKSWYVYDTNYLSSLVRYVEFNPIKANITKKIGEYKWAMSSKSVTFSMLNFEFIENTSFEKELDETELKKIDELYHSKVEIQDNKVITQELKDLQFYFEKYSKEKAIFNASRDGYKQKELGEFLGLSHVAISKIIKIYKQKVKLFNKLRDKGIFWSYKKDVVYDEVAAELFIEYLLKYGDFDDIKLGFELFGKRYMKEVWEKKLKADKSFIKTNLMLARVFFGMDVESNYFKGVKNARFEKLKLLAS
jgi:REP element-mobilizing transposase RayT